jgi:DNA-binding LacI/PurR family transcriptional regulator
VGFVPTNFYEPDVVEAIYGIAKTAGYRVVLSAHAPGRGTDRVLAELQSHRCAGVITIGSTLEERELAQIVRRMQTPVTLVGHGVKNDDYDVIHSRGDRGIERCLQHLVSLGHREIAYVDAPTLRPAPLRLSGYLRACQDAGISPQVFSATEALAEEAGASAARQLLSAPELPTAIACVNDQAAFGAAMVLSRAGKRIPEDVSITGFDDSRMARWTFLDLTSARQDPVALGESAVASLLRRIADRGLMPQEVVVDPELVIRSSTSGPRRSN